MSTLYRSPTVTIGDHEWHLTVRKLGGRIYRQYKWRPVSTKPHAWQLIEHWPGRKPKLWMDFEPYRKHAVRAEKYERSRSILC